MIGLACDLRTEKGVTKEVQMNASDIRDQIQEESAGGGSIWVSLNGDFSAPYGLGLQNALDLLFFFST